MNSRDNQDIPKPKRDCLGRIIGTSRRSLGSQDDNVDDDPFADLPVHVGEGNCKKHEQYAPLHSDNNDNFSISDDELDGIAEEVDCPVCNKKFGYGDSLKRHFSRIHIPPPPQPSEFRCDNCNLLLRNGQNLKRHINNTHTGSLDYKCIACPAEFATKRSLSVHAREKHADKTPEEGGPKEQGRRNTNKIHKCDFCDYTSHQNYNVIRHFRSKHFNGAKWFCPYGCGKVCKSKANMKIHSMSCCRRPV